MKGILLLIISEMRPKMGSRNCRRRLVTACIHPRIPAEAPIVKAMKDTKGLIKPLEVLTAKDLE